jgi:diguanylate cyclase (GGDEF)-like protein
MPQQLLMRIPRFSDIPIVYKISLPQAFALLILGSVGAFLVGSQQRQTLVLEAAIGADTAQAKLAVAARSLTIINNQLYALTAAQVLGSSQVDRQKSLQNILGEVDDVGTNLATLGPHLSNQQGNSLAGILQDLASYRSLIEAARLPRNVDFGAAAAGLPPFGLAYAQITRVLNQTSQSLAEATTEQVGNSVNETNFISRVMFILVCCTLLLTMTVAPLITTAVQRAIILICEATVCLASGRNDVDLERLERGDEFGAIVRSMIIFRENQYRIIALNAESAAMQAQQEATRIDQERITCMISALSATNEAILHAETRGKLFQLVCEAAVLGGKFSGASIALPDPGGNFLRFVAVDGPIGERLREIEIPLRSARSGVPSMVANAFLTKTPCVENNLQIHLAVSDGLPEIEAHSAAAVPLISDGKAVCVLLFLSAEPNTFILAFVELLQRLTRNVAFALENLDRAGEKQQAEERIRHLATHDGLTDLPNRTLFNQLLEFSIQTAKRHQQSCAVLFVDLDRFKLINDSLGHAAGDALLVEMARRLRDSVRACDVVARIGGDEFVVLLNEINGAHQVKRMADRILSCLSESIDLNGQECRVTASISIAIYPDDGIDDKTLTQHADLAMYLAKTEGKNGVRLFTPQIKSQSADRLLIESDLRNALHRDELRLHYQPKLDVRKTHICGVEALVRWQHPQLGLLAPVRFIPIAEETDLILPIGSWVIKTACAQNIAWQQQGFDDMSMAVNVSPRQFMDDNLLRDIDDALATSGMEPKLLQIEITESMVMLNIERAIRILNSIHERGVRLAIDDFGTGYSSMSMLKRFPIDTIKIDRSFVQELPQNTQDKAIASAIINMGKALGLRIVAEGVETVEQEEFLVDQGCDEIQGYLFSKPGPAEKIAQLFRLPVVTP